MLGCRTVRLKSQSRARLRMQPYPGVGISFGRVTCMTRAASVPGLWTLDFLPLCGACVWVWVSREPRQCWLGCWAVCVFVCALRLYPTTPGWGVRCGCVSFGSNFSCAPPLLAGVVGRVCVCVRAPLVPRHSWLGCAVWVCVLGLGFRLRPATPGWGVGVCVCLCACSACTPPLQAGVCAVGVCAWAGVSAALRHPWLGCPGVCVFVWALRLYPATPGWGARCGCVCLGFGFRLRPASPGWGVGVCVCLCARSACTPPVLAEVCGVGVSAWARASAAPRHSLLGCWGVCVFVCALCLYLATPGWGARCGCLYLGLGFGCAPPLLAGVLGCVCVCVRVPLVPRHSWLGCVVWVCALGLRFQLRPATPGCCVGVCVCLCARSACTPPVLAEVCDVGVCAWAPVSSAPRQSWLGCWDACLFVCALPLYPATPGWGVAVCVCWYARSACTPRFLAGVRGVCVCVLVLWFRLHPATPGWAVGGCVCLCAHSACTPPLLARVCGVGVCAWARVSTAPRHSWLGCWGVCVCVCLCARSACTSPLLPGVYVVGVCAWAGVSAAPRQSWLRCWCVCVCALAPLVPRHSLLGSAVWVCVLGVLLELRPATLV